MAFTTHLCSVNKAIGVGYSCSLSDGVCAAKASARAMIEEYKAKANQPTFDIKRDGEIVEAGFNLESDAFRRVHQLCPHSFDYAERYEGYIIERAVK